MPLYTLHFIAFKPANFRKVHIFKRHYEWLFFHIYDSPPNMLLGNMGALCLKNHVNVELAISTCFKSVA